MRIILGFLLGLVAVVIAAVIYIYSGAFNIAATDPHVPVVRWALDTTMHHSLAARTETVEPPAKFSQADIRRGAERFRETCVMCHGGPGVEPTEVGKGVRPEPPDLAEVGAHMNIAEQFWVVKHGIKMTAMPAFGETHSDKELWAIIGFLQQLPAMSPQEYREMSDRAPTGQQG